MQKTKNTEGGIKSDTTKKIKKETDENENGRTYAYPLPKAQHKANAGSEYA